jgi:large subunit ribosomal protein LP1
MALSNDELACVYAALILADDNVDIKGDKIAAILKAANYDIEPYWPGLFASALEGVKVTDLIKNIGSAPVAAAPTQAATTTTTAAAADDKKGGAGKEAPKKEEKKQEKDESDEGEDMVRFYLNFVLINFHIFRALAYSIKTQSINNTHYRTIHPSFFLFLSTMFVCLSFTI